jgi:hypothetical protein
VPLGICEKLKLFDSMILPIKNYGYEIRGCHISADMKKVYIKFLKQIFNVKYQTTNETVCGEFDKVHLYILRKERILKYWCKIVRSPDILIHKCFMNDLVKSALSHSVKSLLDELDFSYLWNKMF